MSDFLWGLPDVGYQAEQKAQQAGPHVTAPWPKIGEGKCDTFTQCNTTKQKKNNDILNFAGKWMELENITLSKVTQTQKNNYHMYLLIGGF